MASQTVIQLKYSTTSGNTPVSLANGYLDRPMHLIGPRYFDVYTTLLKMIIPIQKKIIQ